MSDTNKGNLYQLRQNTKQPSVLKDYFIMNGNYVPPLKRRSKKQYGQPRDNGGKFMSFKPSDEANKSQTSDVEMVNETKP